MTAILGISAYYHDSAAALWVDGEIAAAFQEERLSRRKFDESFPVESVRLCLEQAGLRAEDLDYVGFYDKPFLKFERLIETHLAFAPGGFRSFARAMPVWLKEKLWLPSEMRRQLGGAYDGPFVFTEHHESHAAGAFLPSPFEEAAILTFDGVGEWATASYGVGRGRRIELTHELRFPHSLGLLYSAFTAYTGFRVNSDEYKLMGLAPYGEPRYVDLILDELIDLADDGSLWMDMAYFDYGVGSSMTSERFHELFGGPPREAEAPIERRHMDLAASVQRVTEEVVLRSARHLHRETGLRNLCLSGGVALNCVANGRLQREGPFDRIWIQPAAGDSGSALGVALFIAHQLLDQPRQTLGSDRSADHQHGSLLGDAYQDEEIEAFLRSTGASYRRADSEDALVDEVAALLDQGSVVGWFQGRMEFGPRALGSRSILGDARQPRMQSVINQKVKFREGFRPFAPAVLREHAHEYFDVEEGDDSPYMLVVSPVGEQRRTPGVDLEAAEGLDKLHVQRSEIPAVTHVDFSARLQTVDRQRHGRFHALLDAFYRRTGCPVLVNTSFNLSWEPIVSTPREAYESFMSSELDVLCIGSFILRKSEQRAFVSPGAERISTLFGGLLACPRCGSGGGEMAAGADDIVCGSCGTRFSTESNIPRFFWPHEDFESGGDVTQQVKQFYEENPFPNYQEHDSVRSLIDKSRAGGYAHALQQAIPFNSTVLEVGCGTGQLTNFLGVSCRRVIGTDLCLNSLKLGEEFRAAHDLGRVGFAQMNLFKPAFHPESFDVVLCNGVLHHTSDPRGGFEGLVPLVKPGGYIVIGLYNRWGRWMMDARRAAFRLTGGRARWLDPYIRSSRLSADKERAWFMDQYRHPHESKHSMGEVLGWFAQSGLDFVRGVPSLVLDGEPLGPRELFVPADPGSRLDRLFSQAAQVVSGNREGGFFVMIGRKPERT